MNYKVAGNLPAIGSSLRKGSMRESTELAAAERTQQNKYLQEELESSITEAEWQLLQQWNATQASFPLDKCIHQLFEEQVERTPGAIAVLFEGEQLTYSQLNQRVNHLVGLLRAFGVGPEYVVALLAERSPAFLTAMLAIWKAGGAYLPLDPRHPSARIRQVLEHSGSRLVVAGKDQARLLAEALGRQQTGASPQVIYLEDLQGQQSPVISLDLVETSQRNLAYVIYTSGSTGVPKGVMIEQRGMINHLYAKINTLQLTAADCVAQTASQCFDISIWQFLAALLVGGSVHIFPDKVAHDPQRLLEQVEEHGVSILETVPSLLRVLLESIEMGGGSYPRLEQLRWLVPTGEALPPEFCSRWLALYPQIPLLNAYGPTECSDDVTHQAIFQPLAEAQVHTPIGRPIQNMQVYILDRKLRPVSIGADGELCVGGVGVGRGYLHDSRRTAEAFVPDPFSPEPGARLYRTGDLARYLSDGTLVYLGRIDYQVKIRGYRIETGEIEALLRLYPDVRDIVVIAREDSPGDKYLAAYVVASAGVTVDGLRYYLKGKLPDYMVPASFILLEALPLSSNGKIDRRALPVPERIGSGGEATCTAPTLLVHQQLIQIWEQLLDLRPIGIRDNFFELGGHSLLAAQMVVRIEQVCGRKIPLATLFAHPTIEQIAEALQEEEGPRPRTPVVTVQVGKTGRPFFFLHGDPMGRAFYCFQLARSLGPEHPFYVLEPYRFDDLAIPPAIETMAAAHIEALRAVQPQGPYMLGGWCDGGLMAYEMARQLHAQGQVVDLLVLMNPAVVTRVRFSKLLRGVIRRSSRLLHLSEEKQIAFYLRLQHMYESIRLIPPRARLTKQLKSAEAMRPEPRPQKGRFRFADFKLISPSAETQNYRILFNWVAQEYTVGPYAGKITILWAREDHFEGVWKRKAAAEPQIKLYFTSGSHMTSRTEHLPELAENFRRIIVEEQEPQSG